MDKHAITKFAVWARNELIERVSKKAMVYGISENEVRQEMQRALDAAFQNPDRKQQAFQRALFGEKKPTLEEFILRVGREPPLSGRD